MESYKKHGTFNTSLDEKLLLDIFKNIFNENDILINYKSELYPYKCDFYIKSEDKFIEVHGNWTHGGRPFDPTDIDCLDQLAYWDKKAETSDYYKNAIYTWAQLDVQKVETARKNHLNFEVVYVKR